ncbi:hypothetical protein [Compostibacter hankyongensis]|uniref:Uncharacterized protein n=1 Tax=Compostibacter hankyongensis TaxID=1007089 RepID=A0ABP8FK96_9BACT
MEYREIRLLVERYWDCETSLEEEEELRRFFSVLRPDLPEDLREAALLFGHLYEEAGATLSDPVWNAQLEQLIREGGMPGKQAASRTKMRSWWKYAAVIVALLAGSWLLYRHPRPPQSQRPVAPLAKDTYHDPEKAYAMTREVLMLMAANLNKGKQEMQKLSKFHEAEQKIQDSPATKKRVTTD